ncbi:MAG: cytosine deaminase [Cyanobacteria bacterium]|nr:cytosine deaminase [Cyanobacteria bacterium CG_2015-16_32_12]NCO76977.1 cytosine deaminase [Cyanobacteria bacterium CG_2015-22_32_23]NCQ04765.1 cytosine deaminase [Cyanobacteria bacterium CG_2015-09_32_10]NCQ42964.1 cytosine deaminase [Cyanobacteria bacterium CG_2015-04_32_10]NCS85061.1 cytosine deaminase [Cyanobacteria bacterium CG_2015-02_32_10]
MINHSNYWLKNAHIPTCLIVDNQFIPHTKENLCLCDIQIQEGKINQIIPASNTIGIDLQKGIVLPCFVDIHTHLDKGHIFERSPNLQGDFKTALETVKKDSILWNEEDLYQRMEFGLKCSYAHGTIAIRTHLDCHENQADTSLKVWQQLQQKWQNKINLQAVSLISLDYFLTENGVKLADKIAEIGGILGGVAYTNPELEIQLEKVFQLAKQRNLDLDFHADENGEIDSICLQKIAEIAIKTNFTGNILCGHCCSLSVQPEGVVQKTINLVKEANINIVSLPMCNLYLQDRQENITPFWRGITKVKELKKAGVKVTFASDNCRDPFFGFGDHDLLEVFNQSVRIGHLDTPYSDWITSISKIPADLMKLPELGRIGVNLPANLVVFKARYFSELLSRNQRDRLVIRNGKIIKNKLPKYKQLDQLNH